jgi:hypothetical protein
MFMTFKKLWADDSGSILSLEIILVATVLLLGVLTGLASLRDAIITELADIGGAISDLDQSFIIRGPVAASSATVDTVFNDRRDFGDIAGEPIAVNERCLVIAAGAPVAPITGGEGTQAVVP